MDTLNTKSWRKENFNNYEKNEIMMFYKINKKFKKAILIRNKDIRINFISEDK